MKRKDPAADRDRLDPSQRIDIKNIIFDACIAQQVKEHSYCPGQKIRRRRRRRYARWLDRSRVFCE